MAARRYLSRAPIKEALIDLQVDPPPGIDPATLDSKHGDFAAQYPRKASVLKGAFGVQFESGKAIGTTIKQDPIGFRFTSDDEKQVVQFRTDGFTFSRLEPYQTWEKMKAEAEGLWNIYASVALPSRIKRVATRYINMLPLPVPIIGLAGYLVAPPQLPPEAPPDIQGFLTRLVVTEPTVDAVVIITQAMEGKDSNRLDILLDIDAFVERPFDVSGTEHWQLLEQLRELKNRVFFGSLTETAVELFA